MLEELTNELQKLTSEQIKDDVFSKDLSKKNFHVSLPGYSSSDWLITFCRSSLNYNFKKL